MKFNLSHGVGYVRSVNSLFDAAAGVSPSFVSMVLRTRALVLGLGSVGSGVLSWVLPRRKSKQQTGPSQAIQSASPPAPQSASVMNTEKASTLSNVIQIGQKRLAPPTPDKPKNEPPPPNEPDSGTHAVRRRADDLDALNRFLFSVQSLRLNSVAHAGLEYLLPQVQALFGVLYLSDSGTHSVELLGARACTPARSLEHLALESARLERPVHMDSLDVLELILDVPTPNGKMACDVVAIPFLYQQQTVAVLVIGVNGVVYNTANLFASLAMSAFALALRNAALHRRSRRRGVRLWLANRRLQEKEQRRCRFIANICHDMRTSLNALIGFSCLLARHDGQSPEPERRRCLDRIRGSATHLLTVVDNALDLSKIDLQHLQLQVTSVDARCLGEQVVAQMSVLAEQKNLNLRFECAQQTVVLQTDAGRLRQALTALLDNAIKFTDAGQVCLTMALKPGRWLEIGVIDSGIGIDASKLSVIFEPFERALPPSGTGPDGSGLGLSVTKGIVQTLGGTICVLSHADLGAAFYISLPLDFRSPESSAPAATHSTELNISSLSPDHALR